MVADPAVVVLDARGVVTGWNAAAGSLTGWGSGEALGAGAAAVLAATAPDGEPVDLVALAAAGDAAHELLLLLRPRRGDAVPVRVRVTPVVDGGGPSGVVVVAWGSDQPPWSPVVHGAEGRASDSERHLAASEARFRALVQHAADVALLVDLEGRVLYVSPAAEELFRYGPEDMVGRSGFDFVHPDDLPAVKERWEAVAGTPGAASPAFEFRAIDGRGRWRWIEERLTNLCHEPAVGGVVANLRDVSARRAAEAALRASEERHRTIVEAATDGICVVDDSARVTFANPSAARLVGRDLGEVLGASMVEFIHADDVDRAAAALATCRRDGTPQQLELRLVRPDGHDVEVLVSSTTLRDDEGAYAGTLAMLRDVGERKRAEEAMARMALTDELTGLPNRTLLLDRLRQALARAARHDLRVAVLHVDLDEFKLVNDVAGHERGDQLLRLVAARLVHAVREADTTVARLGGDDFVVLCEGLRDGDDALGLAERLHAALAAPVDLLGRRHYVTASIGVAMGPPADAAVLLANAGAAMYGAKAGGRGRTQPFDEIMRRVSSERLTLHNELRTAVDEGQLLLHYQPVVAVREARVVGVEALLRWQHPERGLVPPARFVAAAEDSGLIGEIGAWVLRTAAEQAATWARDDLPLTMGVNLSARQLAAPGLVAVVADVLAATGLDAERLVLEVTESVVMDDVDVVIRRLAQLRQLGVRLAIDDFGTGYSSLMYLSRLPVHSLKIDRSFVAPLPTEGRAIVTAIVQLAAAVGVDVVAEGVETPEQEALLRAVGCGHAQGYLWSRPVPAEAVPGLVRELGRGAAPAA